MKIVKRRQIKASELKDYMLVDFDDNDPPMVHGVVVGEKMVNFIAHGTEFSIQKDEEIFVVTRMTLVENT